MEHIFTAHAAGDQPRASTLAGDLEALGFGVVVGSPGDLDQRRIASELREARCTMVIWSASAEDSLAVGQAADAAVRYNVMIPVCAADFPAEKIPARFSRVRPGILLDPAARSPLALDDPATLARVISPLWRISTSSDGTNITVERRRASAKSDWAWVLLTLVAFLAFCVLVALGVDTALKHYNPYANVYALNDAAAYVTARRRHAHKLEWLVQSGEKVTLAREPALPFKPGQEITILVHGYNVPSRAAPRYFDEAIAHLRGGERAFIIFDWPTGARAPVVLGPLWQFISLFDPFLIDTVASEAEMYNVGRQNARSRSSEAFAELVEFVHAHTGRKVNIVAHSMGCFLILEAIRKRRDLSSKIDRLVFLAPAVHHDALDHPDIATALANTGKIQIFYSNRDSVLSVYAALRHAAPMLGAVGPKMTASQPKNFSLHDVTTKLQGKDVHGAYLTRQGLLELSLAEALVPT